MPPKHSHPESETQPQGCRSVSDCSQWQGFCSSPVTGNLKQRPKQLLTTACCYGAGHNLGQSHAHLQNNPQQILLPETKDCCLQKARLFCYPRNTQRDFFHHFLSPWALSFLSAVISAFFVSLLFVLGFFFVSVWAQPHGPHTQLCSRLSQGRCLQHWSGSLRQPSCRDNTPLHHLPPPRRLLPLLLREILCYAQ